MPANIEKFLLNTDYPLDKVIYQTTYNITIPAYDFATPNFTHGLSFTPLISAQWSTVADFSVAYNINGNSTNFNTSIEADSTKIYFSLSNNTASSVTFYFKIYGFMPSGVNVDIAPTASAGSDFLINTDYNYTKLFTSGIVTGPGSGNSSQTVTHSLGFVPQVALWEERPGGRVYPKTYMQYESSPFNITDVTVTDSNITVNFRDVTQQYKIHYRIYGDAT